MIDGQELPYCGEITLIYTPGHTPALISLYFKHWKIIIVGDIFYSGDTYETNFDLIPYLESGNLIYQDTCLNDNEENVNTSLRVLSETIPSKYRNQVYCIHIDGENFIEEA